ncbi:MAG: putative porin [Ginsengibacter sp.]
MFLSKHIFLKKSLVYKLVLLICLCGTFHISFAQLPGRRPPGINRPIRPEGGQNLPGQERGEKSSKDTMGFEHRDDLADSITISFKYLDSLGSNNLDTSLNDYGKIFTVPAGYVTLGNNGNAAYPILFSPIQKPGWDAGFHGYDLYRYTLENTRFFKTTRPYTELSYLLATGKEQVVKVLHTQNIKPNWNAGVEYRLISSPGLFKTQNSNHNSYRFFSNYQGKRKRYAAWMVLQGNKLNSSENGGVVDKDLLHDPQFKKRFTIPVTLGSDKDGSFNVFSTSISTGNTYGDFNAFFRQSYDFGIKDSLIINDTTTEYLFYPKIRFLHTISYNKSSYQFRDIINDQPSAKSDSSYFTDNYGITLRYAARLNFWLLDEWKNLSNDFTIKQFPQTKNPGQYIEAGIRLENISGAFSSSPNPLYNVIVNPKPPLQKKFFNVVLHGEYRNKTKNKKWDAMLNGEFYATGDNAADFSVNANLNRFLNARLGDVQISFKNVNRTPSYIYQNYSAFNLDSNSLNKKENITIISVQANNPRFSLMARNISIANFIYLKDYYHTDQFNALVNLTQITASTKNKVVGHFNLYSDFIVQQTTGQNPIRVPLFYTRQRLAFEGNFFKNLNLSTGIDVRYNTPYKLNNYSPVMGKFFPQDTLTISNLPQLNFFFNFRIKTFKAYITAENINTISFSEGFGFSNNNFAAPQYPINGFMFRFGLQWNFIN